jgi:hypothetical protein
MIGCVGGATAGMTRCAAEAEREDEILVETDVICGALQAILENGMFIGEMASTWQQFQPVSRNGHVEASWTAATFMLNSLARTGPITPVQGNNLRRSTPEAIPYTIGL